MAKVTNAFTSYGAKGNREVLLDKIYNVDPLDTPVLSLIGRTTVAARTWDWQIESLPTATAAAQLEGFEVSRAASQPTVRVRNVTQINSENATVAGSQEKSNAAGKPSGEMAHQLALKTKVLKVQMDKVVSGNQALVDGNDTTPTARETRGLENWIVTNNIDANAAALDKDMIEDLMEALWNTNGATKVDTLVMSYANQRRVSGFTPRNGSQFMVKPGTMWGGGVTVYVSDNGDLKILPSRNHTQTTVLGIAPDHASTAYFRSFERFDLAKIGDAETKVILSEYGVQCDNEKAFGKITDLLA